MSGRLGIYSQVGNGSVPALPLLLDVYPGAAAAYSLRKIAVATTNVVEIRRSDNVIQDFTANEITDGTLSTWAAGLDAFVSVWYDQSGNGNNAEQVAALNQPKLVSLGVVIEQNSKPTLFFDPVNMNTFAFNSTLSLGTTHSIFMTHYTTRNISVILGNTSPIANMNTDSTKFTYNASGVFIQSAAGAWLLGQQYIHSVIRGGSLAVNIWGNGNTITMPWLSSNASLTPSTIGGRSSSVLPYGGNIQEMIIYPTDESLSKSAIETNINTHYAIYSPPPVVTFISATGGIITTDGNYKVHTFNSSSNFIVSSIGTGSAESATVEYLVIAGGGGGSNYGGGGAGGYRNSSGFGISATTYPITIGGGGAGGVNSVKGTNGSDSIFSIITAVGGGAGGSSSASVNGNNGGSGGGSAYQSSATGGVSTAGQGNNGGTGSGGSPFSGGGGGGANAIGGNGGASGGTGGNGTASSITGTAVTRAGGGGGGTFSGAAALGGTGGGGNGGRNGAGMTDGTINTGSGGGGFGNTSTGGTLSGAGGSGVIIIRYKFQ